MRGPVPLRTFDRPHRKGWLGGWWLRQSFTPESNRAAVKRASVEKVLPRLADLAMERAGGVAAGIGIFERDAEPQVFRTTGSEAARYPSENSTHLHTVRRLKWSQRGAPPTNDACPSHPESL
jgi:hypothetical protein